MPYYRTPSIRRRKFKMYFYLHSWAISRCETKYNTATVELTAALVVFEVWRLDLTRGPP